MNKVELLKIKKHVCEGKAAEPIDIVFLTFNRLKYFVETIQGLIKNTRYPYRIIIVDNNSDADFKTFLKKNSELFDEIIYNEKNEWTKAFQKGIEITKSDPFIVSDPDIIVPNLEGKCWLEKLLELQNNNSEIGLLALNLSDVNKPLNLPDVYLSPKEIYSDEIILSNVGTVFQSIKRRYYNFNYITDWETCEGIRLNGGKVGFAKNILAYHLGWNEESEFPEYLIDKFKYFKDKYDSDTYLMYVTDEKLKKQIKEYSNSYYIYSRPEVQNLVSLNSKKILDVGCSAGLLGYGLKIKLEAEVWGIEIVKEIAEKASLKLDKVINLPIEKALEILPNDYFDTIIFADVLEHLTNPYKVLEDIKEKLKSSGEIILSLPNITHWSVIRELLNGSFDYADSGILDKTHMRFFTKKSIVKMIDNAGLKIFLMHNTKMQNNFVYPADFYNALKVMGIDVENFKDESEIYQYILKVHSKDLPTVSIVMPFFNQAEVTIIAVNSILSNVTIPNEIILVDDGSSEEEFAKVFNSFKIYPTIKIIRNEKNGGFPYAVNKGLVEAIYDYIIIANNDIIVTKNAIERMVQIAKFDEVGIVGCMTNFASGLQVDPDAKYSTIQDMYEYAITVERKNQGKYIDYPRVVFVLALIKRELIERIGGLDERFSPGYFEDDDFCLRSRIAGFKNVTAQDVFIHHFGSKSFSNLQSEKYKKLINRNSEKFKNKWGLNIDEIWIENKIPKKYNLTIPINKNLTLQYLLRGLINIEEKEYELALYNLDKMFEIIKETEIQEINGLSLTELEVLRNNLKKKLDLLP